MLPSRERGSPRERWSNHPARRLLGYVFVLNMLCTPHTADRYFVVVMKMYAKQQALIYMSASAAGPKYINIAGQRTCMLTARLAQVSCRFPLWLHIRLPFLLETAALDRERA